MANGFYKYGAKENTGRKERDELLNALQGTRIMAVKNRRVNILLVSNDDSLKKKTGEKCCACVITFTSFNVFIQKSDKFYYSWPDWSSLCFIPW